MKLCSICKETLALGKCEICKRDVCRYCSVMFKVHITPLTIHLEFGKVGKRAKPNVIICKKCYKKFYKKQKEIAIHNKKRENLQNLLSKPFFEILLKKILVEEL